MFSSAILFGFLIILGPIITMSSSDWILAWVGLELSFLGLIPMFFWNTKASFSKESALKYFCIQALSSAILFFSGVMILYDYNNFFCLALMIGVTLKMGLFPGHFWVIPVVSTLDWFPCLILLSWQKIPVLLLISMFSTLSNQIFLNMIMFLSVLSSVVGGILGLNVNSIRAMVGSSSIVHTGWVIFGSNSGFMWGYFFLYSLVLVLGLGFIWSNHILSGVSVLSMSGLPPFVMFVGKWNLLMYAVSTFSNYIFIIILILGSAISLIFYLKFTYSFYLNHAKMEPSSKCVPLLVLNLVGFFYLFAFFDGRK